MALDRSSTLYHDLPVIAVLALFTLFFILATIYYLIIYPLRKDRRRKKEKRASVNASASVSSLNTVEAPRRELHRWIPTFPTPTTPGFSPVPRSPRPRDSGCSFQTGALSTTPRGHSIRSLTPESRPISELDMLHISNVAATLTPPPSAIISEHAIGHLRPLAQHHQDPFSDPDPSSIRGPSHVRSVDTHADASPHAHDSPVAVPPAAASICNSVDTMSITTSSTLPPSYRTHRPTFSSQHRTACDAPFSGRVRGYDMVQTTTSGNGVTSRPTRADRRSRYYPRRSADGGVRLEGGPVDPATGRGAGNPPRYGKKL